MVDRPRHRRRDPASSAAQARSAQATGTMLPAAFVAVAAGVSPCAIEAMRGVPFGVAAAVPAAVSCGFRVAVTVLSGW